MRALLIFANILLACIIAQGAIQWLNEPSVNAEVPTSAKGERRSSTPQPKNIQQQAAQPQRRYASVSSDNQVATTVALNIFDPERAPKATVNNRRNATPVNRADMTLVGTFTIGDIAGAIILQRSQQMQQMRQQMGRNNNQNGNTNTAEELAAAQEQQMQQALENRAELNTLLQALQQTEGVTEEQTARIQQRIDQSNQQIELLQNQNQQRNTGRDGLSADGSVATANASNSYKQYIRVGETLSNGYTLAAVTRTSATLTRGQEQPIELAMADASANAGRGGMGAMGGANRMGGMGGFGGGMGGMGGMMGGGRAGQLQRLIDSLKADTPRDEALKKIEAKDKDAYAKIKKALDDANKELSALAKKAEVELPDTTEQQKAKTLEFLAKEKEAIDKLLETDKTDSATAMRSFNELAQKNNITINPVAGRGGMAGMPGAAAQQPAGRGAQGGARSTNTIRQIQEKFPEEYKEVQKLRQDDPDAYREKMRELQRKLNEAK